MIIELFQDLISSFITLNNGQPNITNTPSRNGALVTQYNDSIGSESSPSLVNPDTSPESQIAALTKEQANDIWDEQSLEFLYNFQSTATTCDSLVYQQKIEDGNSPETSYVVLFAHETSLIGGPLTIPTRQYELEPNEKSTIDYFKEDVSKANAKMEELKEAYSNIKEFDNAQICIDPFSDPNNIPNSDGLITLQGYVLSLENTESNRAMLEELADLLYKQREQVYFIRQTNTEGVG